MRRSVIAMFLLVGCASTSPKAQHVSVLDVALHCRNYEHENVTVMGIGSAAFEDHSLCPSRDLAADPKNCLWLALTGPPIPPELMDAFEADDDAPWVVDGTVNCKDQGHLGLYAGTLANIQFILASEAEKILWSAKDEN